MMQFTMLIHQKGAFRKFCEVIEQTGILQKWYEFRDKEYEDIVKGWCEKKRIGMGINL